MNPTEIGLEGIEWFHFADDTFWVCLMSFAIIILYAAWQQVFIFLRILCALLPNLKEQYI